MSKRLFQGRGPLLSFVLFIVILILFIVREKIKIENEIKAQ